MTREEVIKLLNELQGKGLLQNANIVDRTLPQEVVNDFSIEQLGTLLEKGIITNNAYYKAKSFLQECEKIFTTRMQFVLSTGKRTEFPFESLRAAGDLSKMYIMVEAELISFDEYNREAERRKQALKKFNDLIKPKKQISPQNTAISFTNFVVLSNVFKCNKNHHIEQIQATINILTPSGGIESHQVSAGYCIECGIYFILETDFQYLSTFGVLLCRKLTRAVYLRDGDNIINGEELNAESLLHQIGYNVNAKANLGSIQRQNLLKLAIDNNLYSISGLLSFLDWLIARNKKVTNRNMSTAIEKWTEDRIFIANYQADKQRKVGVQSITAKDNDWDF